MSLKKKKANSPAIPDITVSTMKYVYFSKKPKKNVVIKPAIKLENEYKSWKIPEYFPLFGYDFTTYRRYPP